MSDLSEDHALVVVADDAQWLARLGTQDAGRLLDAQRHPPRGRAREQVLAQAAGNPMALAELSVSAAD